MEMLGQRCVFWGETPYSFDETLKWIEKAGRTCYDSLEKITPDSYIRFTHEKAGAGHHSILEHSNHVMRTASKPKNPNELRDRIKAALNSSYLRVSVINGFVYVSGNYRAFLEDLLISDTNEDAMYVIDPHSLMAYFIQLENRIANKFNKFDIFIKLNDAEDVPNTLKRITFEFITDRAVTHELVRHRRASFSQRSQRYVRENNLQVITPYWFDSVGKDVQSKFLVHILEVEKVYRALLDKEGPALKAEAARAVLPNCCMTILVMTASVNQWKWVLKLRDHSAAYQPARDLAHQVGLILSNKGWL